MFDILHLHNGIECKVFDRPDSLKHDINVNDIIVIDSIFYKVYEIQYRFDVRGGDKIMPLERMIIARNREEEVKYQSVYGNINRMERAIDFFKKAHKYLNTGHSLQSAYETIYNE